MKMISFHIFCHTLSAQQSTPCKTIVAILITTVHGPGVPECWDPGAEVQSPQRLRSSLALRECHGQRLGRETGCADLATRSD